MNATIDAGAAARPREEHRRRLLLRGALALVILLLLFNAGKMLAGSWLALHYPYDLDYGEGIVWQQMRNILSGEGYSPLGTYPAIVYHYPPVYHLTTAAIASILAMDQLIAGRLVSLLSTIASMAFVGMLVLSAIPKDESRIVRMGAAAIGGLCLASIPTILNWSTLMRVDMLGCALMLGGLLLSIRAVTRPAAVPFAALAFVLAVYTKQTNIAAPLAALIGLWFVRPKSAFLLLGCCVMLGLVALAALVVESDGGFLRHILLYNVNRLDLSRWRLLVWVLFSQALLVAIAGSAMTRAWRRLTDTHAATLRGRVTKDDRSAALLVLMLFMAVNAAMLPLTLKSGASDNYLIAWSCGIAMFVGLAAAPMLRAAERGDAWPSPILITLFIAALSVAAYRAPPVEIDPATKERMAAVVARIRASAKPVISDDMVLLIRAGRPVQYEPAIAAELAHSNLYDEAGFARMVRRGDFGFFLTRGDRGSPLFDERYNPRVAAAIDAAYPRKEIIGDLVFHLPAQRQ
ncbi:MAG: hypothetical protein P0Y64_07120 [Candidatus Sphingomonas colombiensis]|nr:hypothetical protein [Sphingomonas sp.]WEK44550.1 MAG: hypothetical protein P0Y64_07120 [Sphingomonas sp.]